MSNKIESVRLLCQIQIRQFQEREKRLRLEIMDGRLQIEYLKMLIEDIGRINVLNYLDSPKNYMDLKKENNNEENKT